MRLIDTDEMNEKLFYRELGGKDVLITAKSVFDMIKALPTAYDVEKVVAELESKDDDCGCGKIGVWEAIDIVKRGGAE